MIISSPDGIPEKVTSLYLDGNNMLFMTGSLRKFALGRGQKWKAEAMLTSLAKAFAGARAHTALNNTTMIFDKISHHQVRSPPLSLTSLLRLIVACASAPARRWRTEPASPWQAQGQPLPHQVRPFLFSPLVPSPLCLYSHLVHLSIMVHP